jgi:serine/threonine protein kinase
MYVYHLDLKFENILLGKDFRLKITDFDRAFVKGDKKMIGKGTECYRAPEIKSKTCKDFEAADIFSLGIILFAFLTGGMPYPSEDEDDELLKILLEKPDIFWDYYQKENEQAENLISKDLKFLFLRMVCKEPEKRIRLEELREHAWVLGDTYEQNELEPIMSEILSDLQNRKDEEED